MSSKVAEEIQRNIILSRPELIKRKSTQKYIYVPCDLKTCTNVFLREEIHKGNMTPPYGGPYKVVNRTDKTFTIDVDCHQSVVSIDRVKPAYILKDEPNLQIRPSKKVSFSHLFKIEY